MELLAWLGDNLWTLFVSALISSTLLPGGSEALLVWQLEQAIYSPWLLVLVATTGNVAGSMLTFMMGCWLARRYPFSALEKPARQRARHWLERTGPWALLLAWLPVIGDPLCLVAGWLRLAWLPCLVMITLGKAIRYLMIASVAGWFV